MSPSPRRLRKGSLQSDQVTELRQLIKDSKAEIINVLGEDLKAVKQNIQSLTSRLTALEESVQSIQRKHEQLTAEISNIRTDFGAREEESSKFILREMDDRMQRTTNVIIRGLPEGMGSVEERAKKDEEQVQSLLKAINAAWVNVGSVRRLGKVNKDKPRFLRVSFRAPVERQEVLRKAKQLKNTQYKDVFIQRDLTRLQQGAERLLRKELRDRRDRGEDVVIYAGEVHSKSELSDFRL